MNKMWRIIMVILFGWFGFFCDFKKYWVILLSGFIPYFTILFLQVFWGIGKVSSYPLEVIYVFAMIIWIIIYVKGIIFIIKEEKQ